MKRYHAALITACIMGVACMAHADDKDRESASTQAPYAPTAKATIVGAIEIISAETYGPNWHRVVARAQVTGTVDEGGGNDTVCMTLYDDGTRMAYECSSVPVGITATQTFTMEWHEPLGFPGVAVALRETADADSAIAAEFVDDLTPALPPVATPVPTLGAYGLMALSGALGVLGWRRRRRMQAA